MRWTYGLWRVGEHGNNWKAGWHSLLAPFVVHCGKHTVYKEQKVVYIRHMWDDYVCPKCEPADTDLDHDFNCFKCSAQYSKICFCFCKYCSYGSRWCCCKSKTLFVFIYFCFQLTYWLFFDPTQISPPNYWEQGRNQVLRSCQALKPTL